MVEWLVGDMAAKVVQGERSAKEKLKVFHFALPSRSLPFYKVVKTHGGQESPQTSARHLYIIEPSDHRSAGFGPAAPPATRRPNPKQAAPPFQGRPALPRPLRPPKAAPLHGKAGEKRLFEAATEKLCAKFVFLMMFFVLLPAYLCEPSAHARRRRARQAKLHRTYLFFNITDQRKL